MSILPITSPVAEIERTRCGENEIIISTRFAREIFVHCGSSSLLFLPWSPAVQAAQLYARLAEALHVAGARMHHVVAERIFFQNLRRDFRIFAGLRRAAYRKANVCEEHFPVATYLGQPPCYPPGAFAIQAYAVVPNSSTSARITSYPAAGRFPARKIVQLGGHHHLYTGSIQAFGSHRSFQGECDTMFETATDLLRSHGTSFQQVLRTWCYLRHIDRDYTSFNQSRNSLFKRMGVDRYPASTGVGAELYPTSTQSALSLYTLLNPHGVAIEPMHAATLNEAPQYGSSFSRGLKICLHDKTVLLVSGTALIDEQGRTAHEGDIRRQIERTLRNVRELLKPQEADFGDLVEVLVYLKSFDMRHEFLRQWNQTRMSEVPCTIVQAELCRPNLLCELEALAVLPPELYGSAHVVI